MVNFSIRGIDEETARRLKAEAKHRGVSLNSLLVKLIQNSIGIPEETARRPVHHDLDDLAGTWTDEETAEFLAAQSDFEQIDEDLWR